VKIIFRLIVLVLLLLGWGIAASALHIVRTPNTLTVIPKDRLHHRDTYADTRNWTLDDVPNHAPLVRRLLAAGKANALAHLADPDSKFPVEQQIEKALESVPQPPTTAHSFHLNPQHLETAVKTIQTTTQTLRSLDIAWGN
jgi:hypothetical protein